MAKRLLEYVPGLGQFLEKADDFIGKLPTEEPSNDREDILAWEAVNSTLLGYFRECREQLDGFIRNEWEKMENYNDQEIYHHVVRMLACLHRDPDFRELNSHDQNLLLWAALLHDIAKRGAPDVYGKDPFHPFASCATALEIFYRLGWIHKEEATVRETIEYIRSASVVHLDVEYMDNTRLPSIVSRLYDTCGVLEGGTDVLYSQLTGGKSQEELFLIEVLLVILFHQSLTFLRDYPAFTPIEPEQIVVLMSKRLLMLIGLLAANDSLSYLIPYHSQSSLYFVEISRRVAVYSQFLVN